MSDELHVAYVSELAPGQTYSVFGEVCRTARSRNIERGVAGLLLFDGQRFCQWLYGKTDAVSRMFTTIANDPRHTSVRLLLAAPLPARQFAPFWRSGFVEADALDAFLSVYVNDEQSLIAALARLVGQADLEPEEQFTKSFARQSKACAGEA